MALHSLPQPTPPTAPRPRGVLIGDVERDATCAELAQHYAAGRLTAEEMDDRMAAAVAARTHGDLVRLTSDLPGVDDTTAAPLRPLRTTPTRANTQPSPMRPAPADFNSVVGTAGLVTLFFLTVAAMACTMLLLFGAAIDHQGGLVWLAAFGTAVSCLGSGFFYHRHRVNELKQQMAQWAELSARW